MIVYQAGSNERLLGVTSLLQMEVFTCFVAGGMPRSMRPSKLQLRCQ